MEFPELYRAELWKALETIDLAKVGRAIEILEEARDQGRCIFVCGNGGSASSASHFATDMVKGASYGAPSASASCRWWTPCPLSRHTPTTSATNASSRAVEELRAAGGRTDGVQQVGQFPNVLRAMEYGNSIGCRTIALTGRDGGRLGPMAQLNIQVSHPHIGRIEDLHMIVMHMICYYFMDADSRNALSAP